MDYGRLCRLQHEAKDPVEHIIDLILTKGAEILYMKYVLAKQPEFLGELYSKTCCILIDDLTIAPDRGDDRKALRKFWAEDKEPQPAAIDTWARHRVGIERPDTLDNRDAEATHSIREESIRPTSTGSRFKGLEKDDFSYCSNTEPETRKNFLFGPFESEPQETVVEKTPPPPPDPKIDKVKRELLEKKAKLEREALYNKNKIEQEKELEKKKKEFVQSISKKSYTFDYQGKIMYLKPAREDNIAVNELTEIGVNRKNVKTNNPPESSPKVKIAEILERENGEATYRPEDNKKRAQRVVGMFRPAPGIMEVIQPVGGVTVTTGKNQVKKGQVIKEGNKLRFDEFREKHRGEEKREIGEDSEEKRKRELEAKERKEKKYRRTIDNWKEELKRGLKDHLDFDPELLINLIMTDDMEAHRERKLKRRVEREKVQQDYQEFRKKLQEIIKHPEQFLNRVAVYKPEDGQPSSPMHVDQKLINDFQKVIMQFNDNILNAKPPPPEDIMAHLPSTEMEADKYKFTRPKQMTHSNLIDIPPPRIRHISSAVGMGPSSSAFNIKRVQSGTTLKRSDSQASRLLSGGISHPPSASTAPKGVNKYIIKGSGNK
jgi:hypothetical protein